MSSMRIMFIIMVVLVLIGFVPWLKFAIDNDRFPQAHEVFSFEFGK